jgi:hypothetical protein
MLAVVVSSSAAAYSDPNTPLADRDPNSAAVADDASTDPFGAFFIGSPEGALLGGQQVADAGARWAHIAMYWRDVEPTPGEYDWSQMDAQLGDAAALGYQVIVFVSANPFWAADTGCGPIREEQLPAFAAFLTAAVNRYSVAPYNVLHWQIYNEPDNADATNFAWLGGCWGKRHPNQAQGAGGAAYAHMMTHAYPAIKAGNPNAQVLLGALAYDNWYEPNQNPNGPFDPLFLDEFLLAGGGDNFDIISYHYYPAWAWMWNTGDRYTSNIFGKANYLQTQVQFYTGKIKPVVCTEVSMPTNSAKSRQLTADALQPAAVWKNRGLTSSEEEVARYVIQAFVRGMSFGQPYIIWLEAVDEPRLGVDYGLLRTDLSPKPSYHAFHTLTTELSGADFVEARRDFPENLEGYDFIQDGRSKSVLWNLGTDMSSVSLELSGFGGVLRVVDKSGGETLVADGSAEDKDGQVNGRVTISVDASPIFAETLAVNNVFLPYSLTD